MAEKHNRDLDCGSGPVYRLDTQVLEMSEDGIRQIWTDRFPREAMAADLDVTIARLKDYSVEC